MRRFLIYGPNYDLGNGGALVLHYLCHYLNLAGYEACYWPKGKPVWGWLSLRQKLSALRRLYLRYVRRIAVVSSELSTPVARRELLPGAIVIYGGNVDGNPLRADHIVRYNLHVPGFHTGRINYGGDDLFFHYRDHFSAEPFGFGPSRGLYLPILLGDIFGGAPSGVREGRCYIVRKGKGRIDGYDLSDGVVVDGLSLTEVAAVFRTVEYCISFDLDTMLSSYAALSGCKSVVIPEDGVTKEEWRPDEGLRLGLAYGFGEVEWAQETVPELRAYLESQEADNLEKVRVFAETCLSRFGRAPNE